MTVYDALVRARHYGSSIGWAECLTRSTTAHAAEAWGACSDVGDLLAPVVALHGYDLISRRPVELAARAVAGAVVEGRFWPQMRADLRRILDGLPCATPFGYDIARRESSALKQYVGQAEVVLCAVQAFDPWVANDIAAYYLAEAARVAVRREFATQAALVAAVRAALTWADVESSVVAVDARGHR